MAARNRTMDILGKALHTSNIKFDCRRKVDFDTPELDEENDPSYSVPSQTEQITPEQAYMCEEKSFYGQRLSEKTNVETNTFPPSPPQNLTEMTNVKLLDNNLVENEVLLLSTLYQPDNSATSTTEALNCQIVARSPPAPRATENPVTTSQTVISEIAEPLPSMEGIDALDCQKVARSLPAPSANETAVPFPTTIPSVITEPSPSTKGIEALDCQIVARSLPAAISSPTSTLPVMPEPLPSTSSASDPKLNDSSLPSNPKKKRKSKQEKQYYDYYLSDEDDFTTIFGVDIDSDTYKPTSDSTSDSSDSVDKNSKKKKLKKKVNKTKNILPSMDQSDLNEVGENGLKQKRKNIKKERQRLKRSGQAYTKNDGTVVPAKEVKLNPCIGKKCGNDCGSVTEDKRKSIHTYFWNLSVTRRKDWLVSMTRKTAVKRKRAKESDKRTYTYQYTITEGEGKRPVCLQFLAATLDVGVKFIQYTVQNSECGLSKEDNRGRCEPHNKTKESTIESVMNFIKRLPAVPSHYCRKDSSRVYLPSEMKNLANLYKVYKKTYTEQGIDVVSERVFRSIFNEKFNIGFHVPKKDKCLKCLKFERNIDNPEMEEEKKQHELEKTESYNRFKAHQNIQKSDPGTLCASFDLQKVLNTPYGDSMLLFYSRKLAVYNFCIYENGTRKVFCYYWDESNGKRGANEIATILNKYIHMVNHRGTVNNLLLYCDCCPGQNRNRIIMAMLHTTLQTCNNIKTIQINFLLTGHTYMPVDSVHAVIERNLKNSIIYSPSQWYTVFLTARQDPEPYNVEILQYKDFNKWDSISEKYFKGNLTGKISKMRIVTFKKKKDNVIFIKNSMKENAESFCVEVQPKTKVIPPPCYKSRIPLSKAKLDDLLKLCRDNVIPYIFQNEYNVLTSSNSVKDTLPESDMEDVDLE